MDINDNSARYRAAIFKAAAEKLRAMLPIEERRSARVTMNQHGVEVLSADGRLLASSTLTRGRTAAARAKVIAHACR